MDTYPQAMEGADRSPGYLDELTLVLENLERQCTILEDRLRPVSVLGPNIVSGDGPIPAPDNKAHELLIGFRRCSDRMQTVLGSIRL